MPRNSASRPTSPSRILAATLLAVSVAAAPTCAAAEDWPGGEKIDAVLEEAVARGLVPGAVLWIESRGERLHFASYGSRSIVPEREPMTSDTLFDCASLTKVLATAPAIMMLVEEGKVRLNDRLQTYLPEFRDPARITVQQLLTHYSGLRPGLTLDPAWSGYETGVALALQERPAHPPGSRFVYSDINYILLAEIVRRAGGEPIDQFVRRRIHEPLGMSHTMYRPPARLRSRTAPTEVLEGGEVLRGVVHDPTTRMMGGASGQAGLFSTAEDVARFARMMLSGGELDGVRILSPLSVLRMRTPQSPPGKAARGLGWDIDTPYSSPRGDLFGTASYGHTGYTGPSLWIDPASQSFVAVMTNRVHPEDGTSIVRLRSRIASIAAASISLADARRTGAAPPASRPRSAAHSRVQTGLDTLAAEDFAPLAGKSVALVTNHTGIDRRGRRNIDLLANSPRVDLRLIFSPEHGLDGTLDIQDVADGRDTATGIPFYSLYRSDRRRPPVELLRGLDALVFDIQDAGARFYTYITTMGYAMEAAAQAGVEFFVLDRPNPVNGVRVEGPVLDADFESFVGYHSIPVRHGMTIGELAKMFNAERKIGAQLTVVPLRGWSRHLWFDQTGLQWTSPSPNLRTIDQATLYPGIALLEWLPDYSVGRGTDTPFQFVGADWLSGAALADAVRRMDIPGASLYPRKARPRGSVFAGAMIDGVQITITDREKLESTRLGFALAVALRTLHPNRAAFSATERLIGNRAVLNALANGATLDRIQELSAESLSEFTARRNRHLLY